MKQLLKAAGVSALILSCGCSPSPDKGKIVIRYMAWGNPEQLALEEQLCHQFTEKNPDVLVKFVRVPGTAYGNKSVVMLASDTAPDVLRIDHYDFNNLQKKRFFHDLTDLAAQDHDWHDADFFPQAIGECKVNGRLYGLSVLFGATVIYYNKTMIAQAGQPDPYQLWQEGKWTLDKYVQIAQALTKRDAQGKATQFGTTVPAFPQWFPYVWAFGGDVVDLAGHRSKLTDEATLRGLQFIADLRYKYACAPTPSQGANAAFTFESGKLGMQYDWMGMTPRYRKVVKSFDWDVVPIPSGPNTSETVVKGNQLVMPANCQHPAEAWRFMRYLTSPEIENLLYAKNRRCFPTRKSVANSKEFLNADLPPKQIHIFLDAVKTSRQLPIDDRWSEWTIAMNNELDQVWNGTNRDVKSGAERASRAVDKVLNEEPGW